MRGCYHHTGQCYQRWYMEQQRQCSICCSRYRYCNWQHCRYSYHQLHHNRHKLLPHRGSNGKCAAGSNYRHGNTVCGCYLYIGHHHHGGHMVVWHTGGWYHCLHGCGCRYFGRHNHCFLYSKQRLPSHSNSNGKCATRGHHRNRHCM
jgi:hypothetical protein